MLEVEKAREKYSKAVGKTEEKRTVLYDSLTSYLISVYRILGNSEEVVFHNPERSEKDDFDIRLRKNEVIEERCGIKRKTSWVDFLTDLGETRKFSSSGLIKTIEDLKKSAVGSKITPAYVIKTYKTYEKLRKSESKRSVIDSMLKS